MRSIDARLVNHILQHPLGKDDLDHSAGYA